MEWPLVISEEDLSQEKIVERLRFFLRDAVSLVGTDFGCFRTVLPWLIGLEELYLFSDERSPLIPFARKSVPVPVKAGNIYLWNCDENIGDSSFVASQLKGSGVVSLVYVPLFFGGRVWAKLTFLSKRRVDFDKKSVIYALNYLCFGALMLLVNYDTNVRARLHTTKWRELTHRFTNTAGLLDFTLSGALKGETTDAVKAKVAAARRQLDGARIVGQLVLQERNTIVLGLGRLLSSVFHGAVTSFGREGDISFEFLGDPFITLSLAQSQVIAAVAFELFANSLKYAIRDEERGVLTFKATQSGKEICLLYSDSGPCVFRSDNAQGTGLGMIKDLIEQIGGSFVLLSRDSFLSEIRLPS